MLDTETKRRIDTARDILVGKVPDPKSQVEQITIALIYKFMHDMDSEAEALGGERTFFKGEFEPYAWSHLMSPALGGHEVLSLYSTSIQKMNINPNIPQLFRDIFKNAFLPYRDPETLKSFLKVINEFQYDHSEKLGDAFEYLLSVLGSQGEAGQFRTPRHIIDFIVDVVDPHKEDRILDVACGTAGFLISAWKHIIKMNSSNYDPEKEKEAFEKTGVQLDLLTLNGAGKYKDDLLTPDDRKRLAENIHGYDISPDMVRLSLVNMYLHSIQDPHISEYDTLTSEDRWNEYFDVILANPPFMSPKGGIRPHNRFSVQSKRSEVLFVDYIAEHLTPNGRAGVIVPEGIIFQSQNAYKQLREMLVKEYLIAVVSLPAGVFNPYSGVKTSILLLDKQLNKKMKNILFVKISNDGFDLGAQRRPIQKNDLPEAARLLKEYVETLRIGEKVSVEDFGTLSPLLVEKERLAESGEFNLSGERYKNTYLKEMNSPLIRLGDESVFQIDGGGTPSTKEEAYWNGSINWATLVDLPQENFISYIFETQRKITDLGLEKSSAVLLPTNSIIVSTRATIGRIAINKVELATNQGFKNIIIKDKSKALPEFVSFILTSLASDMEKLATGGTFKELSKKNFCDLQIPLPPLNIQREIVDEIEGYQKIIEGAQQVVEHYKPQITIDPEWEMVKLKSICIKITKGSSPKWQGINYTDRDNGILFITSENVGVGELLLDKPKYVEKKFNDIENKSILQKGDVLTNIVGASIGRTAIFDLEEIANINQAVCILRSNTSKVMSKYLMHYMNSDTFLISLLGSKVENARANVSMGVLGDLKIPLPDLTMQERLVAQIEHEQALVNANKKLINLYEAKIKERIARIWGE